FPLQYERFLTRFCLDSTDLRFELAACTEDHHSAWRDHDYFACAWIPARARDLASYGEHTKLGDADPFALLEGGFEEPKYPVQERGRLLFRDPSFLMQAVSDVVFNHLIILASDPIRRKTLGPVHAEPIAT